MPLIVTKLNRISESLNSIKNLKRLQLLHLLIENEQTGPPRDLANRMHISERVVYSLIEYLKDFKANICYDRRRKTYYYSDDFQFKVNISVSIKSNNETIEVFGGSYS